MPSAWPSLSVRSDSVWKSLVVKLCSLCGNPQVIFPWTVARFRALPSSTSKMCSALEGRPASRGAPRTPSRWFQTRMSPRCRCLAVFVRLLYIWCSTWKIPWPTLVWNKSPHPHGSFLSQGVSFTLLCSSDAHLLIGWAEHALLDLPNLQIQLLHFPESPSYRERDTNAPDIFRAPGFTGRLWDPLNPCSL